MLVSGGTADRSFVTDFMTNRRYDLILAVDGGLKLCHDAGILPTHLVGDFDTVETPLLEQYAALPGIQVIRHNPEKDATDTELAMDPETLISGSREPLSFGMVVLAVILGVVGAVFLLMLL